MSVNKTKDNGTAVTISNGLLLYYHQYSFYSQKVLMALYEKNIPFDLQIVDLSKGEQYESWFLTLNPRGEVPVLQDKSKIVPDSTRILDYLEDTFYNDHPTLIPMDQGPETRQKVTHFRGLLDKIPAGAITMGSIFHPELVENRKLPFIAPVRKLLAKAEINSSKTLRHQAELNPNFKAALLQKAEFQDKKHLSITNKDEFLNMLNRVEAMIDIIEKELSEHTEDKSDWWLCTDRFTLADISLAILLERLNQLGLETRLWTHGKRPHVERYYARIKLRDSFKRAVPSTYVHLRAIVAKTHQNSGVICGVGVMAAVVIIIGGIFLVRKLMFK